MAKEEAEREAKCTARRLAAEEAKRKLAEQKVETPEPPATAQAPAGGDSLKTQRARLERNLASAKNSLAKASEPLVANEPGGTVTEEQLAKQQARIKQAELKVHEVEKKQIGRASCRERVKN